MEAVVVISIVGCLFLKVVSGIGAIRLHLSQQVISIITQFLKWDHRVIFIHGDSYMIREQWA
jgi:hypothetical protein